LLLNRYAGLLREKKFFEKKLKKSFQKGKKRKKRIKIEKKVTKWYVLLCVFCKNCTPDSKTSSDAKMGSLKWVKIGLSK